MKKETYSLRRLQYAYKAKELEIKHNEYGGESCCLCWKPVENNYCRHCDQEVNTKKDSFLNLTAEEFVFV